MGHASRQAQYRQIGLSQAMRSACVRERGEIWQFFALTYYPKCHTAWKRTARASNAYISWFVVALHWLRRKQCVLRALLELPFKNTIRHTWWLWDLSVDRRALLYQNLSGLNNCVGCRAIWYIILRGITSYLFPSSFDGLHRHENEKALKLALLYHLQGSTWSVRPVSQ